jgi:serine/threonine protein kinase
LSFIEKYDYGTWQIESQLGEDAFSKVYKIVKEEFDQKHYAALKVIPVPQSKAEISQLVEEGFDDASLNAYVDAMVKDLLSEINLVQKFEGVTNIVNYEDHQIIPKEDEIGYYILIRMELLESLANAFKSKKLGEDDAARVGLDICRALESMERHEIIHRGIKPDNIFVSEDGDYKLGVFGIAGKIEITLSGRGTCNYMAPEVFKGQKCDATVDQYSLGIVLYQILNNGRIPFAPTDATTQTHIAQKATCEKRINGTPLPPPVEASQEMSSIILKACSYEPSGRYANATEMRVALEDYVQAKSAVSDATKHPETESEIPHSEGTGATDEHERQAELKPKPSDEATEAVAGITEPISGHPVNLDGEKPVSQKRDAKPFVIIMLAILVCFASVAVLVVPPLVNGITPVAKATDAPFPTGTPLPADTPFPTGTPFPTYTPIPITEAATPSPTAKPSEIPKEFINIMGEEYSVELESLDLSGKNLTDSDLIDLKWMTNLRSLDLRENKITDCSLFSDLNKLENLCVSDNDITDISSLSKLENLKALDLFDNKLLTDFTAVYQLKKLEELHIGATNNNYYEIDISGIKELENLNTLQVERLHFSDFGPISTLKNLTKLTLTYTSTSDISQLFKLNNLTELTMQNNKIDDISALSELKSLSYLNLSGNWTVTDLSPLSDPNS